MHVTDRMDQILEMAENPGARSTEELQDALRDTAVYLEEGSVDMDWIRRYAGPLQEELHERGGASTYVLLRNEAHTFDSEGKEKDIYAKAVLQWGLSPVATKYVNTDDNTRLECEYVWYDLYVYESGKLLAKKIGIYGDSAWRFVNDRSGYDIVK